MRRWPPPVPAVAHRRATAAAAAGAAPATNDLVLRHNRSLAALLRAGRYDAAWRLFDALPARSVVTWNSFLAGLARRRDACAAREFFDAMPVHDAVSWNTLLAAYSSSPRPDHLAAARRLFDEMPQRDVVTWNTLLGAYARRGLMDEAQRLFDEMPQRNTASWNTMVTGFFAAGQVVKALDVFDAMPAKDSASLSTMVSGFTKNGLLHEAEELLTKRFSATDMDKAVDAYNTLIVAYGQAGRVSDARRLFDMIPKGQYQHNMLKRKGFERNVVSWNSMMVCYIKAGDVCSARALFDEMPDKDLVSWNTMISGYTRASDMKEVQKLFWEMPDPDTVSWNLIIQGFMQKGETEHARGFFDRMPERGTISWNTMISGYEKNGDYISSVKLFSKMLEAGEIPDRYTFSSVLAACASLPMLRLGAQIHQLVEKSLVPDTAINNALITMYSRCGALNDAEAIFKQMHTKKDLMSWNALIGCYEHHGRATKALQLFKEMRRAKVMPTHITFVSLLSACVNAGLVSEGRMVFDTMVHEYGIVARIEHYAALVNLIGRHGQLDDALEVINSMPMAPDRSVWGAFLGACTAKKNEPLAQMAAKELSTINPDSSAPYVLIHNLHAHEGKWGSAAGVREEMERQGVYKQPGYSWIDLEGKMHVFISGDTWHPIAQEIFSVLEVRSFAWLCADWQCYNPMNLETNQLTQVKLIAKRNNGIIDKQATASKMHKATNLSHIYTANLNWWPYCTSLWPDNYLLEEEALFSSLSFPSFHPQPVCSTVMQSNVLQDELGVIFEDDVLKYWDEMELSENKVEKIEKGLPLLYYGDENGAASKITRDDVRSEEKALTFELVSQYFYMPITQAARELNVGLTLLKKKCRELGIPRWPHRKMKSLQTLINNVQVLQEASKANNEDQLRMLVEMLQEERRLLEQKPYVQLEEKTKRLRQACFKANYKKRRLLALESGEP
uniref:RWP-RK domain-containing protein n=1 Tax=Oryza punctata TaxID=4537 RepID=A0A0E0L9L9_ORYPU